MTRMISRVFMSPAVPQSPQIMQRPSQVGAITALIRPHERGVRVNASVADVLARQLLA
jgi:hypothetical protein